MSLTSEQKDFIKDNYPKLSIHKIARQLKIKTSIVKEYVNSMDSSLSKKKRYIFTVVLILVPVLSFILLELSLRILNYGGNLDLFVSGSSEYSNYKICNQKVGHRFFYQQQSAPAPPLDMFLKQKPENAFRIFVLGGSTAAGYPYGNNLMFSRILHRRLSESYPQKRIEIVNTAMAAINSYAFIDYIDEILDQQPDLILIYGGHNEFYGVLGVASSQNLGKNRNIKLAYLQLKKFKTFLFLRNTLNGIRGIFVNMGTSENGTEVTATMMERLVGEQQILYDSDIYRAGKSQFFDNLDIIIKKSRSREIPVILSDLVSNIRDQSPFISLTNDQYPPASLVYEEARKLENDNQFDSARTKYYWAKDLDGLRFRASEDFNAVIHQLSKKYDVPVVAMKSTFETNSLNGLIGNHLMLEHLHPTIDGYFVMADAFYREIVKSGLIDQEVVNDFPYAIFNNQTATGYTELDSVYGALRIKILKGGWPFKDKAAPNKALDNFVPGSRAESLAVKIWTNADYTLERGHVELAEYFEKSGQYEDAFQEYLALIALTPYNVSPYLRAADTQLKLQALENALPLLYHSLQIEQTAFALKWIGQILLERNQVNEALIYLEPASKKLPSDPQLLFNLAGAYALNQQYYKAKAAIDRLLNISPNFPDARNLGIQLDKIINQMDS